MHSLKNTIVAVGLLGLSFVFYQFSSKKPATEGTLISPFENMDSSESAGPADTALSTSVANLNDQPKASIPGLPPEVNVAELSAPELESPAPIANGLDAPELSPPAQLPSQLPASSAASERNPEKTAGNDFAAPKIAIDPPSEKKIPVPLQPRQSSPLERDPDVSTEKALASNDNSFSAADPESGNSEASRAERDQGLIDVLKQQPSGNSLANGPDTNQFQTNPHVNSNTIAASGDTAGGTGQLIGIDQDQSKNELAGSSSTATQPIATVSGSEVANSVAPAAIPSPSEYAAISFRDAWPIVETMVEQGKLRESLELLSQYYEDQSLTGPQREALTAWLDALAGKVIFSAEHHLASPHIVRGGESFSSIGKNWGVPGQLVFNVNRDAAPTTDNPAPGTELKAIPGPFTAKVSLSEKTMTLFLGKLYAGRFQVRIGISGDPQPGVYKVVMKSREGNLWKDANGTEYPPGDANNHYGEFFIGLEDFLCIHAIDESKSDGHWGCIGLLDEDARDIFGILAQGATVEIK